LYNSRPENGALPRMIAASSVGRETTRDETSKTVLESGMLCSPHVRTRGRIEGMSVNAAAVAPKWGPYTREDLHNDPEEGKGFELWKGWLIERMSPSVRHNRMSSGIRQILQEAARRAGADVVVDGGEYEFDFPSGIRKPDVFVLDGDAERAAFDADDVTIAPADVLLVVEVVSPRNGSEPHDRVYKREEYARAGIRQYWIVDFRPVPRIEVLELGPDRTYITTAVRTADEVLVVTTPFEITLVPSTLLQRHI
jgi:Uma2 family endonuclease